MPLLPDNVNGLKAISTRITIPRRGVWVAHVELSPDVPVEAVAALIAVALPHGAVLTVADTPLIGTIDPRGSGVFAQRAHLRIVGGGGAWDKEVIALDFSIPKAIVLSTMVYAATAAEVLELPPLDPIPKVYVERFSRTKGPASRVFGDRDWFMNPITGSVVVSEWPPLPPDPLWTILDFDIGQKRAVISSGLLITPGMIVLDPRFGAEALIIRDVEQTFDEHGSRAEVWFCDKPVSRLQEAFALAVREFAGTAYLKHYKYRFIVPVLGQLALQAITPGAPDLNPIDQWTGLSGITASIAGQAALFPATEIIVGFAGGDPSEPYLVCYSPLTPPIAITIDALTFVNVGTPLGPAALAAGVEASIAALQVEIAAIVAALVAQAATGWSAPIAISVMTPALAAAVAAGVAALAVAAPLVPSKKLLSE